MKQFKPLFTLLLMFNFLAAQPSLFTQNIDPLQPVMRTAIDFGSGALKMQTALVDPSEGRIIGKPVLVKYLTLSLTEHVAAQGGRISEEMVQKILDILQNLKKEVQQVSVQAGYPSPQFRGVATAVFRKAENGMDLLRIFDEQLGLKFHMLSQDEEGKLGFLTAKALYSDILETSLLAWDSGNGSFQMTSKEGVDHTVFQGPLGHGTVRVLLSDDIRKGPILQNHESGNPISREESIALVQKIKALLPPIPDWLQDKLNSQDTSVVTYGEGIAIFALTAQAIAHLDGIDEPVEHAKVSIFDVQRVIENYVEQSDEVFIADGLHCKTLTAALLLSAVMQHFGIESISYKRALGNTPGMLIAPWLSR